MIIRWTVACALLCVNVSARDIEVTVRSRDGISAESFWIVDAGQMIASIDGLTRRGDTLFGRTPAVFGMDLREGSVIVGSINGTTWLDVRVNAKGGPKLSAGAPTVRISVANQRLTVQGVARREPASARAQPPMEQTSAKSH